MKEGLTFNDVLIQPCFSTINSRKDVNLDNGYSRIPIMSANMDTVTGPEMAIAMKTNGGLACLHRFWSIEENVAALEKSAFEGLLPWVSVGVGENEFKRAEALYEAGARHFIIDLANGACLRAVEQYKRIKEAFTPENTVLCVGNFATYVSVYQFCSHLGYKPDIIKVNIGAGSACTTRIKTGVGVPQLSALLDCSDLDIPMIADGGMNSSGDIAKALAVKNVVMVMTGSLLAGTEETPGEVKQDKDIKITETGFFESPKGPKYKIYRGSASKESYIDQGKEASHRAPEGESFTVPYKGKVADVLQELEAGIRSAFTYVNARNLEQFKQNAEFIKITQNGVIENGSYGKKE